ncbi:hypothetical protein CDD81_4721 [Ophiocordyceps australis]|uniref:Uncharacterized protein n=1 Tax=Ophiocordyceps australis TaxID=1399860 RepID=A0A2C5YBM4_9HYPO|nr:hypothetical protein CDD81_4721 [Ophiocordyceps australis]
MSTKQIYSSLNSFSTYKLTASVTKWTATMALVSRFLVALEFVSLAVGTPIWRLKFGPPSIGHLWPVGGATDRALFHRLTANCPESLQHPFKKPLVVALDHDDRFFHKCALFKPKTEEMRTRGFVCNPPCTVGCNLNHIGDDISHVLPDDMIETLIEAEGLNRTDVANLITQEYWLGLHSTTKFRWIWFEKAAHQRLEVCWPQIPGFRISQFQDFMSYLGALMVRPDTLSLSVPERFMDYPPGYINKTAFHLVDWRSYRRILLFEELRARMSMNGRISDIIELKDKADRWGGAFGRIMFTLLGDGDIYMCLHGRWCLDREGIACSFPLFTGDQGTLLYAVSVILELRMPMVFSGTEPIGERPPGVWLMVNWEHYVPGM